jgi:5'-nucleotidase
MSSDLPDDPALAAEVAGMERDLEADPLYAPRFAVIGQAAVELDVGAIDHAESLLGDFVMDSVRTATPAVAAFSTASSFRASIPPGPIRLEDYLTAVPYQNKILALSMAGADVQALLDLGVSKRASDNFAVTSGLVYSIVDGKAQKVRIATDPTARSPVYEDLQPGKSYAVMTTDFMANVAAGYKDVFARATANRDTGLIVNDVVIDYIRKNSPVSAKLDGRITDTP